MIGAARDSAWGPWECTARHAKRMRAAREITDHTHDLSGDLPARRPDRRGGGVSCARGLSIVTALLIGGRILAEGGKAVKTRV